MTYLAIKGPKTSDKGQIPTFSITFPSTSFQEVDVTLLGVPCFFSEFQNMENHVLGFFMKNVVFHIYLGIVECTYTVLNELLAII